MNKNNYKKSILFLSFFIFLSSTLTFAVNDKNYIANEKGDNFVLAESGNAAPIYISSKDFPGVIRIAGHLQTDISKVSNAKPELIKDKKPEGTAVVIAGTIGKNPVIDELIKNKKINVYDIKGKWETFLIEVVDNPLPGVEHALVIAGSDKRGTIFGLYDISSQIGVSPWYWWADVPVKKQENLYIIPGSYSDGEPKVKYRGIFINDEAPALAGWSQEKYGTVQFNHKLYEHLFELILRLKGNFLWPAMWGRAFYDDDPMNPKLADEYGIVISTSHHEPMMRAHVEWERYGEGPWNYEKNPEVLREFWRKGIERMGDYESIVTLAMRGDGDEAMSPTANVDLLERIVKDQREIIEEVTGKDAEEVPQVWALYKEVQEYYDKGMRVPDDVTVLLCDDNWGNIRKLPKLSEKPREGGYGIYYHYDYVGGPRNYKWINTNQIERVWEQMHLAYRYNANQIWVVNVGDIKPMEFPIEFFLDYAWNPENWPAERLPEYSEMWAEAQFGSEYKEEAADILDLYTKFNSRRKPEMLSPETYSLTNYKEAETVVSEYSKLLAKAEEINSALPDEYEDAFFQLVLHPTQASANINELYVTVAKNRLYYDQGRAATNSLAEKAKYLYINDSLISLKYNEIIADGKWNHMMDQTHIGYTYWQQPEYQVMPEVKYLDVPEKSEMGVAIEGSSDWWPDANGEAVLPEFDRYNQQRYYVEIFNRGTEAFDYKIEPEQSWIKIDNKYGNILSEKRIWLSIDWQKVPSGNHKVPVVINGAGETVTVYAVVADPSFPSPEQVNGFVESNGYVSIEAEHYSKAVGKDDINWIVIPNIGRTLSGVTPMPVTASEQKPGGDNPHLEYNVYLKNPGKVKVHAFFSPTMSFHNEGLHYAVSFNDDSPEIVNVHYADTIPDWKYPRVWNEAVANNIRILTSEHEIKNSGQNVLKFWMIDPALVLQKIVIETEEVKPSYLGPPESFFKLPDDAKAKL